MPPPSSTFHLESSRRAQDNRRKTHCLCAWEAHETPADADPRRARLILAKRNSIALAPTSSGANAAPPVHHNVDHKHHTTEPRLEREVSSTVDPAASAWHPHTKTFSAPALTSQASAPQAAKT